MPRCRPFKLIDVMIVIANAAMAMAQLRSVWNRVQLAETDNTIREQVYASAIRSMGITFLLALATAYVWIRLIPPRPPGWALPRQPGLIFLILLIGFSFLLLAQSALFPRHAPTNPAAALALGFSWGLACRHYRSLAEPGWIEALGRFVGVGLLLGLAVS